MVSQYTKNDKRFISMVLGGSLAQIALVFAVTIPILGISQEIIDFIKIEKPSYDVVRFSIFITVGMLAIFFLFKNISICAYKTEMGKLLFIPTVAPSQIAKTIGESDNYAISRYPIFVRYVVLIHNGKSEIEFRDRSKLFLKSFPCEIKWRKLKKSNPEFVFQIIKNCDKAVYISSSLYSESIETFVFNIAKKVITKRCSSAIDIAVADGLESSIIDEILDQIPDGIMARKCDIYIRFDKETQLAINTILSRRRKMVASKIVEHYDSTSAPQKQSANPKKRQRFLL